MPEDTARRPPSIIGHNDGTLTIQGCLPDAVYDVQGAVLIGLVDRLNTHRATIDAGNEASYQAGYRSGVDAQAGLDRTIIDALTAERDALLAKAATWTCDGSTYCSSAEHLHGCSADNPCSHPLDR